MPSLNQSVFSPWSDISGDEFEESETEILGDYYSQFVAEGESAKEPMSDWSFPIVDDTTHVSAFDGQNNTALGVVAATIFWRSLIRYAATVSLRAKTTAAVFHDSPLNR
jgi:hypothetical protein